MEQAALNAFTFLSFSLSLSYPSLSMLPTIETLDLTMNSIHKVFFPLNCQLGLPKWPQRAALIGQLPSLSLAWLGLAWRDQRAPTRGSAQPSPSLLHLIRCYIIAAIGCRAMGRGMVRCIYICIYG